MGCVKVYFNIDLLMPTKKKIIIKKKETNN